MLPAIFLVAQLSLAAGRPAECGTDGNLRGTNIWERAKHPELRHYCDLLATGASKLVSPATAGEALREADEADGVMPGHAAPLVLKGRALAKLGRFADAYAAFAEARRRDARSLDDSEALLAFARSCARSNHEAEAVTAFRALLPRADGLSSSERAGAYVEAAMHTMNVAGSAAGGTAQETTRSGSLDDAIAMLRQARREATDALQPVATLALALALDRSGDHDEARAVLDDRARAAARNIARDATLQSLLGPLGFESQALAAIGLESTDPAASHAAWQAFVSAAPTSPWVDQARSHLGAAPHAPRHR